MMNQTARLATADESAHGWHSSKGNSRGGPLIGSNNEQNCPMVQDHDRAWRKWASVAMVLARPRLPRSRTTLAFFSRSQRLHGSFVISSHRPHPLEWRLGPAQGRTPESPPPLLASAGPSPTMEQLRHHSASLSCR